MNEDKVRPGCVTAWLWVVVIANLLGCLFFAGSVFTTEGANAIIGYGLMSALSLLTVLSAILMMRWNKCGFYLSVIVALLIALVDIVFLKSVESLRGLVSIAVWWAILQTKTDGVRVWHLMEGGWDYKHCRHLYQLFAVISALLLAMSIGRSIATGHGSSSDAPLVDSDTVATDPLAPFKAEQEEVWKTFTDAANSCQIDAPEEFHTANLSEDQTLGIMCTDSDPAAVVICESASSIKASGIHTAEAYGRTAVRMSRNAEGASGYEKISEETLDDGSFLITYNLTITGTEFRYYLLATKTSQNFYFCQVYCLREYAERLQPVMSRMVHSFKALQ